jgi:hypothetical protein
MTWRNMTWRNISVLSYKWRLFTCRSQDGNRVWSRAWSRCERASPRICSTGGTARGRTHPPLSWCSDRRWAGSRPRTGPQTLCLPRGLQSSPPAHCKQECVAQIACRPSTAFHWVPSVHQVAQGPVPTRLYSYSTISGFALHSTESPSVHQVTQGPVPTRLNSYSTISGFALHSTEFLRFIKWHRIQLVGSSANASVFLFEKFRVRDADSSYCLRSFT